MPKSHIIYKANENASKKNFKRQTLQVNPRVESTDEENRKHEIKNPISPKSGNLMLHCGQRFKFTKYNTVF